MKTQLYEAFKKGTITWKQFVRLIKQAELEADITHLKIFYGFKGSKEDL